MTVCMGYAHDSLEEQVLTQTGKESGAGTDAKVFIQFFTEDYPDGSDEFPLNNSKDGVRLDFLSGFIKV